MAMVFMCDYGVHVWLQCSHLPFFFLARISDPRCPCFHFLQDEKVPCPSQLILGQFQFVNIPSRLVWPDQLDQFSSRVKPSQSGRLLLFLGMSTRRAFLRSQFNETRTHPRHTEL